jgi:peptidyl-prolyl cis-trans isomerase A (cyclophilin A)
VKRVFLLLLLTSRSNGELTATFQTTLGDVTAALQYTQAPQAVANFITLSQGTRSHLDTATGAISRRLYYKGEKFFRVVNDTSFKIIQTGSGTGTNSGGPGYTFRNEVSPSLTHVPYVLAMANSGKDTNGSQIYFTGNTAIPSLDNSYTIFGLVADASSKATIDAILAAGNNAATITAITISRTDPAAAAFDEFAQNLPICANIPGHLQVNRNTAATYIFDEPLAAASYLQGYRSNDLGTWQLLGNIYQGTGQTGSSSITVDGATLPTAFYRVTTITYPDALAPASLANRTLVMGLGSDTMTYQFNAAGTGGICIYSGNPGLSSAITSLTYSPTPYTAVWTIQTANYVPLRYTASLKSTTSTQILGSNTSERGDSGTWQPAGSGSVSLTR